METDCEFIDRVEEFLVAAAQEGDFEALQNCLATVPNPADYINRLYDGKHPMKRTLLAIACLSEHEDFVREFLHHYTPDLEVSNVLQWKSTAEGLGTLFDVSALWVAAFVSNLEIVKLLVERGAQVNSVTPKNSTALRCACWHGNMDMVRYLVEKGGDIHISKERNATNLLVTITQRRFNMTTYLVDEAGFDVNECDAKGRSPLYMAVAAESLEIILFLLDRGARNFPSTHDQMSPLMWAAETLQTEIFDVILSHCSELERIEGTELFGSALVCNQYNGGDLERAFDYFYRALDLRAQHHLPKSLRPTSMEVFGHRQEFRTTDSLRAIRWSANEIWTEAMLVRERLFGPTKKRFLDSIALYGNVLVDRADYDQALRLWLCDVELHRKHGMSIDRCKSRHFALIFSRMLAAMSFPSIDGLESVIAVTVENLVSDSDDFDDHLHTLLFLITIASQVPDFLVTL